MLGRDQFSSHYSTVCSSLLQLTTDKIWSRYLLIIIYKLDQAISTPESKVSFQPLHHDWPKFFKLKNSWSTERITHDVKTLYRFSAYWLRSKCSICSNSWKSAVVWHYKPVVWHMLGRLGECAYSSFSHAVVDAAVWQLVLGYLCANSQVFAIGTLPVWSV